MKKTRSILLACALSLTVAMPAQAFFGNKLSDVEEQVIKNQPHRVNTAKIEGFEDFAELTIFEVERMSPEEKANYIERGEKYKAAVKAKKKAERERKRAEREAARKAEEERRAAMKGDLEKLLAEKWEDLPLYPSIKEAQKRWPHANLRNYRMVLRGQATNQMMANSDFERLQQAFYDGKNDRVEQILKDQRNRVKQMKDTMAGYEKESDDRLARREQFKDFNPEHYNTPVLRLNRAERKHEMTLKFYASSHYKMAQKWPNTLKHGTAKDVEIAINTFKHNRAEYKKFVTEHLPRHAPLLWPNEYKQSAPAETAQAAPQKAPETPKAAAPAKPKLTEAEQIHKFETKLVSYGVPADNAKAMAQNTVNSAKANGNPTEQALEAKLKEIRMIMGVKEEVVKATPAAKPAPKQPTGRAGFEALLVEGRENIKNNRLMSPKGNNAYEVYEQMSARFPQYSKETTNFKCEIANQYGQLGINKANGAFTADNMRKAEQFHTKGMKLCGTPFMNQAANEINAKINACRRNRNCMNNVVAKAPEKKEGPSLFGIPIKITVN
ncbi:hypothetical protein [Neptuniibacter sp. QD37_11]|uniref:hypothetical protein n=1 Tax=Neptuniibacter sp. QD37_11 TaxID=3398209 RepID=UPI0039F46E73